MTLNVLDKNFWDYFKQCPRKACLSYYKNNIFIGRPVTFKFKTIEEHKYEIFETTACKFFSELIEKKELSYNRLKEIFYLIVSKKRFKMKTNTKYSKEYKEKYSEMIEELFTYEEFKEFSKILNPEDINGAKLGSKIKVNISELETFRGIKHKFYYKINFPFYKETQTGISLIYFNHSGYPYDIQELNHDLTLTKAFLKKCTEEVINQIIVYDFKSMKRYIVEDVRPDLEIIRRIMKIVDSNLVFPSNDIDKCKLCQHNDFCKDNTKYKKSFDEILEDINEKKKKK